MVILVYSLLYAWSFWIILCWLNGIRYRRQFSRWKRENERAEYDDHSLPPTVIWAAVKGRSDQFDAYLDRVLNQDYPRYKIVFTFESPDDPGHVHLQQWLDTSPPRSAGLVEIQIVIAGESVDQGQKVHNLLAAYAGDGGFGEVIAFIDADVLWEPNTLRQLVTALDADGVELSTGYRWLVPSKQNPGAIFAATINASISTLLGPYWRNTGWAGAMAIKRETFGKYQIAKFWRGKVNDDCSLSELIKSQGGKIAFCPGVTPLNWVNYDLRECFNFGRRQYIQQWVFRPLLWFYANLATQSYLSGWALCIIALSLGFPWASYPAIIVIVSDIALGLERRKIARLLFSEEVTRHLRLVHFCDTFLTPVWMTVHYLIVLSSFGVRHLTWGGIRYRMTKNTTVICSRPAKGEEAKGTIH